MSSDLDLDNLLAVQGESLVQFHVSDGLLVNLKVKGKLTYQPRRKFSPVKVQLTALGNQKLLV